MQKYMDPARYVASAKRRWKALKEPREEKKEIAENSEYWAIRNLPTPEQLRASFIAIRERKGRVLSVFTRYA